MDKRDITILTSIAFVFGLLTSFSFVRNIHISPNIIFTNKAAVVNNDNTTTYNREGKELAFKLSKDFPVSILIETSDYYCIDMTGVYLKKTDVTIKK